MARKREQDPARRSVKRKRYDAAHRADRRAWLPAVLTGTVRCGRCGELIAPDAHWDLDHLELGISHPSHRAHNRGARRNPIPTTTGARQ